jgi:hypothetical protein
MITRGIKGMKCVIPTTLHIILDKHYVVIELLRNSIMKSVIIVINLGIRIYFNI